MQLETNHIGIGELIQFYHYARKFKYCQVKLNISPCTEMDANLSALLLAISYKLKTENKVSVFIILGDGHNIFWRNGLMAHLQGKGNDNPYVDNRQSAIPLKLFSLDEGHAYCNYLKKDFFRHRGLENVTLKIKEILCSHYEELFSNVELHANTNYPVFACGQYFPERNLLKFTLVDLGEGFLPKIRTKTGGAVQTDSSAIVWATHDLNTTKDVKTLGPGGTGLKEIKRYCDENDGSLHICSGGGYVNFVKNKTLENKLPLSLPGSLINLIFRKI